MAVRLAIASSTAPPIDSSAAPPLTAALDVPLRSCQNCTAISSSVAMSTDSSCGQNEAGWAGATSFKRLLHSVKSRRNGHRSHRRMQTK